MIRIGMIGCGGISKPHVEGYASIPQQAQVVACCDVSEERAGAAAALAGGTPRLFADWRDMLAWGRLDAVDICLPHHLHCPAILDAAEAGKAILCEKPLCRTLDEADRIAQAIARTGVTYMASHNQLFHPCLQAARQTLEEGRLGRRFWIRTQDCFILGWGKDKLGWRSDPHTQGGGELIDTGYHPSYMLLHLAGAPVEKVAAVQGRLRLDYLRADDTSVVSVRFADGAIGQILTSWAMPVPAGNAQIHVICSDGQLWGTGSDLWIHPAGAAAPEHRTFPPVNTIHEAVKHFVTCLETGLKPIASLEGARAVLELILAAQEGGVW